MQKNINKIMIVLTALLLCTACGSVRSRTTGTDNSDKTQNRNSRVSQGTKGKNKSKFVGNSSAEARDRFADTTFIYLNEDEGTGEGMQSNSVESIYTAAIEKFNNGEYNTACKELQSFMEMYSENDEIYYSAKFHLAECLIMNNSLSEAVQYLESILISQNVPSETIQQSLVRLGQVYCMQNRISLANRQFSRLKKEYPNSKYLKVANCN